MQLTFPDGEHANVVFDQGEIRIGSRADQDIRLSDHSLLPHHASLVADRSGLWLRVPEGTSGVHVNARPVRRLAWLRAGDQVCLEQVQLVLSQDGSGQIDRRIPSAAPTRLNEAQRINASRVVLRAVSGDQFGRGFSLAEPKVIGRSAGCDIRIDEPALAERHAQFELHENQVVLRALSPNEGSSVNGVPVRDAVLAPGDQIVVDQNRFVLEAPGLPARGQTATAHGPSGPHTQTLRTVQVEPLSREQEAKIPVDSGALWRLIAAAAVLAAALTALLVYAPQFGS